MLNNEPLKEIITALKKGDIKVFRTVYSKHFRELVSFANRYTKDLYVANDIVQRSFFQLLTHPDSIKTDAQLRPWLYTVTRNGCLDYLKSSRKTVELTDEMLLRIENEQTIENEINRQQVLDMIYKEVNKLPRTCKEVFILFHKNQLTLEEIADLLGISYDAVKSHKANAIRALRGIFPDRNLFF